MNHLLRSIALICLVIVAVGCKEDARSADSQEQELITEAEARELLHKWTNAYLDKEVDVLYEVLSDNWVYSGSSDGSTTGKNATIEEFRNAGYYFGDIKYEGIDVKLYGDVAIVRGREQMSIIGNDHKDTTILKLRFTDVYQKKKGRVQAISTHSSPIDP